MTKKISQTKISQVEDALFRLATGYTVEVPKLIKLKTVDYDPVTGKKLRECESLQRVAEQTLVSPNVTAQRFYLSCLCPERWSSRAGDEAAGPGGIIILPEVQEDE